MIASMMNARNLVALLIATLPLAAPAGELTVEQIMADADWLGNGELRVLAGRVLHRYDLETGTLLRSRFELDNGELFNLMFWLTPLVGFIAI